MNRISKILSSMKTYVCKQLFSSLSFERACKRHSGLLNSCMKIAFLPFKEERVTAVNICFVFDFLLKSEFAYLQSETLQCYFFLD